MITERVDYPLWLCHICLCSDHRRTKSLDLFKKAVIPFFLFLFFYYYLTDYPRAAAGPYSPDGTCTLDYGTCLLSAWKRDWKTCLLSVLLNWRSLLFHSKGCSFLSNTPTCALWLNGGNSALGGLTQLGLGLGLEGLGLGLSVGSPTGLYFLRSASACAVALFTCPT